MSDGRTTVPMGVISYGWFMERLHLPVLAALPGIRVVAVADDDPARLSRVGDDFRVHRRYEDHTSLLADPAVEAVALWAPPDRQLDVARAVLQARKHLLIDKPLAFDLNAWEELTKLAMQNDLIAMVGFPRRWHRLLRQARDFIEQGGLGRVHLARTSLSGTNPESLAHHTDRRPRRGILFQFGIHHFDLWHYLLQRRVQEVFAATRPDAATVVVTARLDDDLLVSSVFADNTTANDEVEIFGEAGCLKVSCYRFDGFEYFPREGHPGDLRGRLRGLGQSLKTMPQGLARMYGGGEFLYSFQSSTQHFIDSINRRSRPNCTLEDGRRALQIVMAATESLATGRPVPIASLVRS